MKSPRHISILALAVLLMNSVSGASESGTNANPYLAITARNIFGLAPLPQTSAKDAAPPQPQIQLNGIMTIFGRNFALFKIHSTKEKNYLLAEGQRGGEIRLESVDAKSGIVAVNNHGIVQTLSLPKPPAGTKTENGNLKSEMATRANGNPAQIAMDNSPAPSPNGIQNGESTSEQIMPMGYAIASAVNIGSTGNDSSSTGNSNTADNSGSQNSGGPGSVAKKPPEPWWIIGSKNVEASRIATASLVQSGQAEPYPLTPFTPPGTPKELIGPGQLFFVPSAMDN